MKKMLNDVLLLFLTLCIVVSQMTVHATANEQIKKYAVYDNYFLEKYDVTLSLPKGYTYLIDGDLANSDAIQAYNLTEQEATDALKFMNACIIASSDDQSNYAEIIMLYSSNDFTKKYPELKSFTQDALDGLARGNCTSFGITDYTTIESNGLLWLVFEYELNLDDSHTRYVYKYKTITRGSDLTIYKMNYFNPIGPSDRIEVANFVSSLLFASEKTASTSFSFKYISVPLVLSLLGYYLYLWFFKQKNNDNSEPLKTDKTTCVNSSSDSTATRRASPTNCGYCGAVIIKDALFCNKCGQKIEECND